MIARMGELEQTDRHEDFPRLPVVYLGFLSILIVIVYWSLTRYYFAQDDFLLLERAAYDPVGAVGRFFSGVAGQFRPMTKGIFFVVAHRVFGMHPFPYHLTSLCLHIVNTLLLYVFLRRAAIRLPGALIGATVFAFNGAFFHVLAWISCMQQLFAMAFTLAALIFAVDSLEGRSARARIFSMAFYICALLSFEQSVAVPIVVLFYGTHRHGLSIASIRGVITRTAGLWVVMAGYLAMMLFWKGLPSDGAYQFSFSDNIVTNLVTYLGFVMQIVMKLPASLEQDGVPFFLSHITLFALIAYHLARRRWQDVVVGLGTFVFMIAPTLFLTKHSFYLHTYLPSFGIVYLFARMADDVFSLPRLAAGEATRGALATILVVLAGAGLLSTRQNEHIKFRDNESRRRSFVMRRALTAENFSKSLETRSHRSHAETVYLVYGRMRDVERSAWNNTNVAEAIGRGSAVRLIYNRPDLDVQFRTVSDLPLGAAVENTDLFLYDDMGNAVLRQDLLK